MALVPPKLSDPGKPRDYLLANLVALPGLGSFLAGRRIVGVCQMALALVGFGFSMFWFVSFASDWFRTGCFRADGGPQFRWGLVGFGLFAAGWLWAFATALDIVRQATKTKP